KECHLLFDVVKQERLEQLACSPARVIIVPGIERLDESELRLLAEAQRRGMSLLATGGALAGQEEALRTLFGIRKAAVRADTTASYVSIDDKGMFPELAKRDWVIVHGPFVEAEFGEGTASKLPYIAAASFGPPERAYGHAAAGSCGLGI